VSKYSPKPWPGSNIDFERIAADQTAYRERLDKKEPVAVPPDLSSSEGNSEVREEARSGRLATYHFIGPNGVCSDCGWSRPAPKKCERTECVYCHPRPL
jgi:hypothetical protein